MVVAYEPVWAIGRDRPAAPEEVAATLAALRGALAEHPTVAEHHLLYGGSAQPGAFGALHGMVDGFFLGRFGHDPAAFAEALQAVVSAPPAP